MKSLVVYLLLLISPILSHARQVVNLTNGEWPPYLSEYLPNNGFASDTVREAFKAVGIEVRYDYFPWKRSLYYAQKGESDSGKLWHGSVVWFYNEERAKSFYYSEPVLAEDGVLYHLKSNPIHWNSVEDLSGLVIGGTAHTLYPMFEKAAEKQILKLERAGGYGALFDRLLAKRIDAIPNIKGVADYYLYTNYPEEVRNQVTFSPTVYEKRVYHLILSKSIPENEHLVKKFNLGLKTIKENGVYQRLLRQLEEGYYY